jgi:hypothetical protein
MADRLARRRVKAVVESLTEADKQALRKYRIRLEVVPGREHYFTFNAKFYATSLRLLEDDEEKVEVEQWDKLSISEKVAAIIEIIDDMTFSLIPTPDWDLL